MINVLGKHYYLFFLKNVNFLFCPWCLLSGVFVTVIFPNLNNILFLGLYTMHPSPWNYLPASTALTISVPIFCILGICPLVAVLYYVRHLATVLMTVIKQIPMKSYILSLLMGIFPSYRCLCIRVLYITYLGVTYYISIFKMGFPKLAEVLQLQGTHHWVNSLYAGFVLAWQPVFLSRI